MIVVDASLVFALCVKMESDEEAPLEMPEDQLFVAPEILDLEFTQTLRRYVRTSQIGLKRASNAFARLNALSIARCSHTPLRDRIWAMRDNLTAYDAAYFALAEQLQIPLWTRDAKFARAPIPSVDVRVV